MKKLLIKWSIPLLIIFQIIALVLLILTYNKYERSVNSESATLDVKTNSDLLPIQPLEEENYLMLLESCTNEKKVLDKENKDLVLIIEDMKEQSDLVKSQSESERLQSESQLKDCQESTKERTVEKEEKTVMVYVTKPKPRNPNCQGDGKDFVTVDTNGNLFVECK